MEVIHDVAGGCGASRSMMQKWNRALDYEKEKQQQ
jgi:hypothetical protein